MIIIIAGAPLRLETGLHIGSFILFPGGDIDIYTKQFLHEGEELFYAPNLDFNPQLKLEDEAISLAICSDIAQPLHSRNAAGKGSTLYLASIFYTPVGMINGYRHLQQHAIDHSLNVLMANYGGPCYGLEAGGGSAFWDRNGGVKASCDDQGESLLIMTKEDGKWTGRVLNTA